MNYTDGLFICALPLLALVARALNARHPVIKETILTFVSFLILATWGWVDLELFLVICAANFVVSRAMVRLGLGSLGARRVLAAAIIGDIAVLGFFKYRGFFGGMVEGAISIGLPRFSVGVPLAISFYTFHIISYLVDLQKRTVKPLSLRAYFFYLSFFPHVIAGPIIRAWQLAPQIGRARHNRHLSDIAMALHYFAVGFALKSVAADNIGQIIDPYWTADGVTGLSSAGDYWAVAILYYCQIYADFAGYSLMAIGMARLFGYHFPANFRAPMRAASLREFWRRWHITLSRWLRDYLYIPLGGNRAGQGRNLANLFVTMLLGGLWHGAGWPFLVWGAMHGGGLAVERVLVRSGLGRISVPIRWVLAQGWITLAWVFFRSPAVGFAAGFLRHMFAFASGAAVRTELLHGFVFAALPLAHHLAPIALRGLRGRPLPWAMGVASGACLAASLVVSSPVRTFIYFRF